MAKSAREIQQRLKQKGFDPGPIDGDLGPKTEAAIIAFKKSVGLRPRAYMGPVTLALLFDDDTKPIKKTAAADDPAWFKIALALDGLREIAGKVHNKQIISMWQRLGLPFRDDETPWCAGFVGYCLEEAGVRSTRSAGARSYERWPEGFRLKSPVRGCVVVFWRGKPTGWSGHVGFVAGQDERGNLMVLGGNQGNAVNIKPFARGRVVGYFWPKGRPVDAGARLPIVRSNGAPLSKNEA